MNFAFLVHPLSKETAQLLDFSGEGNLRKAIGWDLLLFLSEMHSAIARSKQKDPDSLETADQVCVIDELPDLVSRLGAKTEGRLYQIPMDSFAILEEPSRALEHMLEAVNQAADWGAKIVGLGSMTGIVGGHGEYMADHSPIPVTTGNSLTVYAAVQNLLGACHTLDIDLSQETLAVVGIPGSIATAAATILAPRCKSLLLVARRPSARATAIAAQLGAEVSSDIPKALSRARVVLSATSSGGCIDQKWLRPGSLVSDVGVPTDILGSRPARSDCLILTGGLSGVPDTMSMDSMYLWFHGGAMPSCLAETMVLALDDRPECLSLGRNLAPARIEEIGRRAEAHGLTFSRMYSFGLPLEESALVRYRKAIARHAGGSNHRANGRKPAAPRPSDAPTAESLGDLAAKRYASYINPVLMAVSSGVELVKTFVRGQGTRVWDPKGNSYLDCVAGYGSVNLGHNHPKVAAAVKTAIDAGAPGFSPAAVNPFAAALAEQLAMLSPPGLEMTYFCNSGTESVEAALKLARRVTGRRGLLFCDRSFHGKTLGALSVTGNAHYQRPFEPLLPGCESVPFDDLESLERALASRHFAAFIVEPIQAEGGMNVPQPNYLPTVQELCRKTDTLLIVDEVQTGMGRTGTLFASDRFHVEPDILTLAKSLGGGMIPIGAMLTRRDLWLKAYGTVQTFALHTTTFGGGSLACAAGLAALKALREENLPANAEARGHQLMEGLRRLAARHSFVRDIRGQGLLIGLEFQRPPESTVALLKGLLPSDVGTFLVPGLDEMMEGLSATYTMSVLLQEHGIYTQVARSHPRVLRVQPPLTITADEVSYFLHAIEESFSESETIFSTFDKVIAKSVLGQHGASLASSKTPGLIG